MMDADTLNPLGMSDPASHVHMPDYVLVFRDDRPPKEHAFTAISDEAAAELMRKQYPQFTWTLYHVDTQGRRDLFYAYQGRPGQVAAGAAGSTA